MPGAVGAGAVGSRRSAAASACRSSWQFVEAPPTFSALSLAVGVAAVRAFRRLGIDGVGLKWPNDLIWQQRKLGGILIEMRGESAGPAQVVIGIGINMRMPAQVRIVLAEQQAALIADVHEIMRERTPTRNAADRGAGGGDHRMLQTFGDERLRAVRRGMAAARYARRRAGPSDQRLPRRRSARARGVDLDGTLLVDVDGELRRFASGEVSLRAAR